MRIWFEGKRGPDSETRMWMSHTCFVGDKEAEKGGVYTQAEGWAESSILDHS
jgi:hypothetical protein